MNDAEMARIDRRIEALNARLTSAGVLVQIERRVQRLSLRGILPAKPSSLKAVPHQQRISLGILATIDGLKEAEKQAKLISLELHAGSFDWSRYSHRSNKGARQCTKKAQSSQVAKDLTIPNSTLEERSAKLRKNLPRAVWKFREEVTRKGGATEATWNGVYAPYMKKLLLLSRNRSIPTITGLIQATIESYELGSRSRRLCFDALSRFCRASNYDFPSGVNIGDYQPSNKAKITRSQIEESYGLISNQSWAFVYGLIAVYGLRNYEPFFCDFSDVKKGGQTILLLPAAEGLEGRIAWPLNPEWIDLFCIRSGSLPSVSQKSGLQRVGQRVTQQFRRYGISFSPRQLREAWAQEAIELGIPDSMAAEILGVPVHMFCERYAESLMRRDPARIISLLKQARDI